jgi:hypothetical protein
MNPRAATAFILALVSAGLPSLAGPLTPPGGAIMSSMKTLDAVEPRTALSAEKTPGDATCVFKITAPGSYYLTANMTVPSGKNGILIAAPGVTVDLNGFTVSGEAGSIYGITTNALVTAGPTVRNGSFSGLNAGVYTDTPGVIARGLRFQMCTRGIFAGAGALIEECTAVQTGASSAFAITFNGVISRCTAVGGSGHGFELYEGSMIKDCSARNHGIGFRLNGKVSATDCSATFCIDDGFSASAGCRIERCEADDCGGDGIHAASRCRVTDCTAINNDGAGVRLDDPSATISVHSSVKGLFARNNAFGIVCADTGCTITGNRCTNNTTNYSIVVNNYVGPIVSPPVSSAINGSSGGAGLGTTDPSANFVN